MEKYFKFKEFGTNYKKETLAGVTTFLATCYIVVVNPQILSQAGMSYSGVVTATVLLSFFSCLFFHQKRVSWFLQHLLSAFL